MASTADRFRRDVFGEYLALLKAQYRIHPSFAHARETWEDKLTEEELVHGPFLEKSQRYALGKEVEELPLHPSTVKTIRETLGLAHLYQHQTDALDLVLSGKNSIVTTGTSSGKTLCFQVPILDDLVRDPTPGLRAVIIYPLNALVNDQLEDWSKLLTRHPQIRFGRFTGQTPGDQAEYEMRLRAAFREKLKDQQLSQHELEIEIERQLEAKIRGDGSNRLFHREAIRSSPPHILITNFSMLEYLLVRPVDAPIFENARLRFLVLDEAHAYRGSQTTEIAFLLRRLKERLEAPRVLSIATSATLGKGDDPDDRRRVRDLAGRLFGEPFDEPNPIHGNLERTPLARPSVAPRPEQYEDASRAVEQGEREAAVQILTSEFRGSLSDLLQHDENVFRLINEILVRPKLMSEVAAELWPGAPRATEGLEALLQLVSSVRSDLGGLDILPSRLHYFVRTQAGLHVCLHRRCSGRRERGPAFFVSRESGQGVPDGSCPDCHRAGRQSLLVEVVTCRKCGYLFGALQDMGPRRARQIDTQSSPASAYFDSFSTELGWAADSFWSYFSVEDELPYPQRPESEDDDPDDEDLIAHPVELDWCVICGKKRDSGAGDNCRCEEPHLRKIRIFHRQCPHFGRSKDVAGLQTQEKKQLTSCPNCGARNASGLEPVRRFQESEDETGLAMAIPLAHFQVTPPQPQAKPPRKLLCFTDHRQRAAAFPSLLEEETFTYDLGRQIVRLVRHAARPLSMDSLADQLSEIAESDEGFFLPVSRFPDEELDHRGRQRLWAAETYAYFGIPDSARESAEDLGLVTVEYSLPEADEAGVHTLFSTAGLSPEDVHGALQVLFTFIRHCKAFTLPRGVEPFSPAFGRVTADIGFALRVEGRRNARGWIPRPNYPANYVTDYLGRLLQLTAAEAIELATQLWDALISGYLLIERNGKWKLDHERIRVSTAKGRFLCQRCSTVTSFSPRSVCPRKYCDGQLTPATFDPRNENSVARWVADCPEVVFSTLRSEEHTAQISKDLAKAIEEDFRAEGVNLLSSTTTFELGINIGDLQKILLRNAPPSSANYVQRVGRAGRGQDKNSICVTLCRRTKYDADAWESPERLISGSVRPPGVFLRNRVIAQRHFNASLFAAFLRTSANEGVLGPLKQHVRLEGFLPVSTRHRVPKGWTHVEGEICVDFPKWLEPQTEDGLFKTIVGRDVLQALGGYESARDGTRVRYKRVIAEISDELSALMNERDNLFRAGRPLAEVERAAKNLLGSDVVAVLAKRGFLPRYAFPLDVVPLETGTTRWSTDSDVELNRDRGVAISEFAPGAQVIAHKKVFTCAGLYIGGAEDKPQRKWYVQCPTCGQIRTGLTKDTLLGECDVCGKRLTGQYVKPFVEPQAFSVRVERTGEVAARHRRNTLIRQRQGITHFIDLIEDSSFLENSDFEIAFKEDGRLFRFNLGPAGKGFILCPACGYSVPAGSFRAGSGHAKLRSLGGNVECSGSPWTTPLAYAHEFRSPCVIGRPREKVGSVPSLAFALQKGIAELIEVDPSQIGVSWRFRGDRRDTATSAEIILYDTAPGGSGFVEEGYKNWQAVVHDAIQVCERCGCEKACYDCLKTYYNQPYHEELDRNVVPTFLRNG